MKAIVFGILLAISCVYAQTYPVTSSFGVSQFNLEPGQTYKLYEFDGTGVVTYFWLTGTYLDGSGDSSMTMIFTVYVDGATTPTYTFTPNQLIGVGFDDKTAPWGSEMMGKDSSLGGIYSHMRVPFFKSIVYNVALPPGVPASILYHQIRITENYPIIIGGVTLPPQARLVQYATVNNTLEKLEFIDFVNTNNTGLVYMHFFQGQSTSPNFMEGCYRAFYDNNDEQVLISTGFEDYYQSAYYFAAGPYREAGVGATVVKIESPITYISGYKIHDTDPLWFKSGGFRLTWRNGDTQSSAGLKCMDPNGAVVGNPTNTTITSYTWVYEW